MAHKGWSRCLPHTPPHSGDVGNPRPARYEREAAFPENDSAIHNCMKKVAALTGKAGSGARLQSCPPPGRGGSPCAEDETDAATTRGVQRDAGRCARSGLIYLVWGKIPHKNPRSAPTSLPLN